MTIFEGSRYEYDDVAPVLSPDGTLRQTILPSENNAVPQFQYSWYTVQIGDRIDIIAQHFLGEADQWWLIAKANPEWLFYDNIPPGTLLRIPNGLSTTG